MSKYAIMYSSPNYELHNTETGTIIKKDPSQKVIQELKDNLESEED